MKESNGSKVRDLRDTEAAKSADPRVAKELDGLKPLIVVGEPHIVTPGVGIQTPGQVSHE
jgi:hypothetical protein